MDSSNREFDLDFVAALSCRRTATDWQPQGEDFLRNPIDGSVALRRLPSHVLPALANSLAISGRLQGGTICFRKRSLHFTISWR
jgi:hypothetical protein